MKKITVAIVGLGSRGRTAYAPTIKYFSDKMEIVAVADIDPEKVADAAREYHIPKEACYSSAEELLEQEKLADALFLCTQDRQHVRQAIPALKKGYHILLEKPVSPVLEECKEIVRTAKEYNRKVVVCHVLRYTPFYTKLKELLKSNIIGKIISIQAIENVGYYHQAHSFVRGNWRNSTETSPMILQKCCHDMDMFLWLTNRSCVQVSSFGNIGYFTEKNVPEGAALRCLDGCKAKKDCPYDAEKIYITQKPYGVASGYTGWPTDVLTLHPTVESVTKALKEGPYGRCVFHCDNDVVDHQVVNLLLDDGSTINFTMCAFTNECYRHTKIMGTLGEIIADMKENTIHMTLFGKETQTISIEKSFSGHGGGDAGIVGEFLDMLLYDKEPEADGAITSLEKSIESHLIAFAAEKSRLHNGESISIKEL